jgi:hypothetical protein
MFVKKKQTPKLVVALIAGVIASMAVSPAFAGGLSAGSTAASNFYTWMYSILGIVAGCYLLYKGLLAWTDKEHWSDFGSGCLKVAGVGAVSVLAPWLWGLFVN